MSDRDKLKQMLQKLDLEDREDEVLNKQNKFGPTTKFDGDKLVWLDLSNMGITSIDRDTFSGLTNIQELKLFKNEISDIPEDTFDDLTELTELHLKDNNISKITPRHFEKLTKLERLFLLGNKGLGPAAKVYPNRLAVETFLKTL